MQVGSGKRKSRPKAKKPARPANPDNLYGGIDLDSAADADQKICPGCASPVGEEDAICSKCGVDVETGVLSQREKKRRSRNAPPPEEFYGEVWKNSWAFLKENTGWAIRTALVWAITGTMVICSVFTLAWYIDGREQQLRDSGEGMVEITDDYVLIDLNEDPGGDARYDGTRYTKSAVNADLTLRLPGPRMGAIQSPPSLFWGMILLVSVLGFGGWAWTLAVQIVKTTLNREKEIKGFHTDLFASMAMGFRSIFWPLVLLWPFVAIPVLISQFTGNQTVAGVVWACIFFIPFMLFLPSALVHLTQKYTYRAWLLDWMCKDFIKTVVPTLYVSMLLLFLVLLVPLTSVILLLVYSDSVVASYLDMETQLLSSVVTYEPEDGVNFFHFTFFRLPLISTLAFTFSFICFGILAFPSVFMMRVYGLFAHYFRPELSLINEQAELERVGFGPRFLASLIDSIMLAVMAGVAWFIGGNATGVMGYLYAMSEFTVMLSSSVMAGISTLALWSLYVSTWESGQNRGTPGKAALGIMVLTNDNKPITAKQSNYRAMAGLVTALTLFAGFAMCAFHPNKSALHDILTKTKVVWRGEAQEA